MSNLKQDLKKVIDDTMTQYKAKILALSQKKKKIVQDFTKELEERKINQIRKDLEK